MEQAGAFVTRAGFGQHERVGAPLALGDMDHVEAQSIDRLVECLADFLFRADPVDLLHGIAREEFEFAQFGLERFNFLCSQMFLACHSP